MKQEINGMEFAEKLQNVQSENIYVLTNKDVDILHNLKALPGNRPIKKERIKEIKDAFAAGNFIPPILVSIPYRFITEGNHRFLAAMECLKEGIPFELRVYFYKDTNALATARVINNTQKRWSANDRLSSYCFENKSDYTRLKNFMDKYSEVFKAGNTYSISGALCILAENRSRSSMEVTFSSGKLRIKNSNLTFGDMIMTELAAISEVLGSKSPYLRDNSTGWIKARTRLGMTFPKFLNNLKKHSATFVCPQQSAKAWFDFYISVAGGF